MSETASAGGGLAEDRNGKISGRFTSFKICSNQGLPEIEPYFWPSSASEGMLKSGYLSKVDV